MIYHGDHVQFFHIAAILFAATTEKEEKESAVIIRVWKLL